ncbi:hypothetical protein ACP70R_015085 [Stipagrostis hirtigluma subsp. patula]
MLKVVRAIPKTRMTTQVSSIHANVSPDDILLKRELDLPTSSYPNFKIGIAVFYTIDKPSNEWRGGVGYVSKTWFRRVCQAQGRII